MAHNFKQLKVWQLAMEIVEDVYKITKDFPSEERYSLTSQINRCSVSVPSNIAEGAGRGSDNEFRHFLSIALGSAFELETQLILVQRIGFSNEEELLKLNIKVSELEKMLIGFLNKLKNN
jgi:four helix bundle protein